MLTIKNQGPTLLVMLAVLVLTACTPAGPRALLEGKKRIEQGRYEQAIQRLTHATSLMPTNAHAWNYLGLAFHHAGKGDEAHKAYNKALTLDRGLSEARYNLGCLNLESNRADLAKANFTAYTLEREHDPAGFLKLGSAASKSGDLAASERAFQKVLQSAKDNSEALTGLGVVRFKRGRPVEAVELFSAALRADPQYAPALLNYGVVARQSLKDRKLAARLFQQYLEIKPPAPQTGPVLVALNQIQREMATEALGARPKAPVVTNIPVQPRPSIAQPAPVKTNKPAPLRPAVTMVRTAAPPTEATKQEPPPAKPPPSAAPKTITAPYAQPVPPAEEVVPPAVPSFNRYGYSSSAKPAPGNRAEAERLFQSAVSARKALRLGDAVKLYREAVAQDPTFFNARFNLALVLADLSDLDEAARAYEAALVLRPDSTDARYNFALVLRQMNYPLDAISELEKLLASRPDDVRAHVAMGNIYSQQLKQSRQAREHYTKALQADPDNPQSGAIRAWLADPRN